MAWMARRPPRGIVVVSELFLKNETILTTVHASRTTKPWYTAAAYLSSTGLRHQRLRITSPYLCGSRYEI